MAFMVTPCPGCQGGITTHQGCHHHGSQQVGALHEGMATPEC